MRNRSRGLRAAAVLLLTACAPHVRLGPAVLAPDRDLVLHGHPLRLHFANPHPAAGRPLLVFATGDGGWHRKDLDAWRHLASWGYPIVGFDARDYVTHLGDASTTTPAHLAADYLQIIDAARQWLNDGRDYPVILVGVSRGAGLSVVAAGQHAIGSQISGVLAVALTREEEYVETADVYDYLRRLHDLPLAVVQSTRDAYLPAAAARELFGPDRAHRRFQAVEARDHSFAGAREDLYRAMAGALEWIDRQLNAR